jgi:hypothetical protein
MSRKNRSSENLHPSRDDEDRAELWTPPAMLDAPPARDGYRQRWVSTQIQGQDVPHHVMRKFREGWVPRPADTIPASFPMPTIAHGQFEGSVGVEGHILCEMTLEKVKARAKYFDQKTNDLNSFVTQSLDKAERAGGQRIEREFDSAVTRGRPIPVDDD